MSILRNLFILSVYLVISVKANSCQNAPPNQDINICDKGTRNEDPNTKNVIIKAFSKKNCICELCINGQSSEQNIIIGRYGNYTSSHPGVNSGCGLIINFSVPNDLFYTAHCSMSSIKRSLLVNQKMFIKSSTVDGNLQDGSGYCIEIINERLEENNINLHLECGLQDEMSTLHDSSVDTTESLQHEMSTLHDSSVDTTESLQDEMSTLHDSSVDTTESGISNTKWTIDTKAQTYSSLSTLSQLPNIKESNSFVTIAVGATVGFVVLLLLTVITIFAVRKSRRGRSTSKRATSEEQRVDDMNKSENDSEYGLQYNSLYNMGFQPEPNNRTTAKYKEVPSFETKKTETKMSSKINEKDSLEAIVLAGEHDEYHTIDSAMETRSRTSKTTDKDGTYSTIEDYANHDESQLDDSDMVGRSRFPKYGSDGRDQTTSHHKNKTDYTEDNNNKDVYAVSNKRKIKHVITTSGCEYAMVNK